MPADPVIGRRVRIDCPGTWGHNRVGVVERVGIDLWGGRGGHLIAVAIEGACAPILYRPECLRGESDGEHNVAQLCDAGAPDRARGGQVTQQVDQKGDASTHYCYDNGSALPHYGKTEFNLTKFVNQIEMTF